MNGVYLYLPASVHLSDIAEVLRRGEDVQDQSEEPADPQVVVLGAANVYVIPVEKAEIEQGDRPTVPKQLRGNFVVYGFESSDFTRIADVLRRVIDVWPSLMDDDRGHVFGQSDVADWLAGHPSPSWADVDEGALMEMPVLSNY